MPYLHFPALWRVKGKTVGLGAHPSQKCPQPPPLSCRPLMHPWRCLMLSRWTIAATWRCQPLSTSKNHWDPTRGPSWNQRAAGDPRIWGWIIDECLKFCISGIYQKGLSAPSFCHWNTFSISVHHASLSSLCSETDRPPYNLGDSEHEFHRLYFICHAHAKHEGEFIVSSVVYLKLSLSRITVWGWDSYKSIEMDSSPKKYQFCHELTLVSFQTCITCFLFSVKHKIWFS